MATKRNAGHDHALFYEGPWYALSNFSAFQVFWHNRWWMTAEHPYQAAKYLVSDPAIAELIAEARSAEEAKDIAHDPRHLERKDALWDSRKLAVMKGVLEAKCDCQRIVRRTLVRSGRRTLIEDSPHDEFWGRGRYGKGANHLGELWMDIRTERWERLIAERA